MNRIALTLAAVAAALAAGCVPQSGTSDGTPSMNLDPKPDAAVGDNGGGPRVGGDVDYPPGVAEGDSVDALDADQRQAACDALEATYANALSEDEGIAFACGLQAIITGLFDENDPEGACRTAHDACLADPDAFVEEEPGDDVCPLIEQPECTATLGEIEACIQFGLQTVLAFNAAFDCGTLEDALNMPPMNEPDENACDIVEMQCPGLLSDDEAPEDSTENTP